MNSLPRFFWIWIVGLSSIAHEARGAAGSNGATITDPAGSPTTQVNGCLTSERYIEIFDEAVGGMVPKCVKCDPGFAIILSDGDGGAGVTCEAPTTSGRSQVATMPPSAAPESNVTPSFLELPDGDPH